MTPAGAILVTQTDRDHWIDVAKKWTTAGATADPPVEVQRLWEQLTRHFDDPIVEKSDPRSTLPGWWKTAYALMAVADEASADLGFMGSDDIDDTSAWIARVSRDVVTPPEAGHVQSVPSITTDFVDQDVVCVQAKARTPDVGAALRNISHNLAMLPPRNEMSVHWQAPFSAALYEDTFPLNLMLVPFPYQILDTDFRVLSEGLPGSDAPSGWFEINQSWLRSGGDRNVVEFVEALIRRSPRPVNGIVFPELSLNWRSYHRLACRLRDAFPTVEFLVAGSSHNHAGERGNFALATHFFQKPPSERRSMASMSRSKHHRWSLDGFQVKRYGLESQFSSLADNSRWWERIPLGHREIHVNAFRNSSVFTVMICEDLARSDPAHEPLRAVGPNLVFVLLMDGPQVPARWSGRYALGLADDPGCSVLTLTSRALVERANKTLPADRRSDSVALWQDGDSRQAREIPCPAGTDAVIVTLQGHKTKEATLDGRCNVQTYLWRLEHDPFEISLPHRFDHLRHAVGAI